MITRTWPYGTQKRGEVIFFEPPILAVKDENKEGYILHSGRFAETFAIGDKGTLTFMKGGPTGGYWDFKKDDATN